MPAMFAPPTDPGRSYYDVHDPDQRAAYLPALTRLVIDNRRDTAAVLSLLATGDVTWEALGPRARLLIQNAALLSVCLVEDSVNGQCCLSATDV